MSDQPAPMHAVPDVPGDDDDVEVNLSLGEVLTDLGDKISALEKQNSIDKVHIKALSNELKKMRKANLELTRLVESAPVPKEAQAEES